ncbi:alpha/beta hydrolase family protein [Aliagarivorans taiwanensis]|uniref:alpha/beta hydrolase family protein n=1 Tax=Aliagarivorans taiwanensis TaxID=561966 RepID=UPI00047A007F|nr:prolyl oligopeptidase family serine peptidase [Aliagarivorans taiwanensis]
MLNKLLFLISFFLVSSCANTTSAPQGSSSSSELLYYEAFEAPSSTEPQTLVVYLPGDLASRNGLDPRYLFTEAEQIPETYDGAIGVSILRPSTHDEFGNKSPGKKLYGSDDNKTEENIHYVASTIEHIQEQYSVTRTIAVGHSGGAMTLGVIIGKYPLLLDAVVLVSTVCDISKYRKDRGKGKWPKSLSPDDYAASIPSATEIVLVTGAKDSNTRPKFARQCEELYQEAGLTVSLVLVEGASHRFSTMKDAISIAVSDLLD